MDALLAAVEASSVGQWARTSRWGYAGVNAAHILGVALLVGAMVPLNLRRLGLFASVDAGATSRLLTGCAAAGLVLAALTGSVLFSARPGEYAALDVFRVKLALVAAGAVVALALHARHGAHLASVGTLRRAAHAVLSLTTWLVALLLGRLIAFV